MEVHALKGGGPFRLMALRGMEIWKRNEERLRNIARHSLM